jgi:hypothetical protein
MQYAHVSDQSAIKFNQINEFLLYGLPDITVEYDVGDNGVEANAISGDCTILPNTIEPLPGDFFSINYIKEDLLFKVDSVSPDTLDTGANIYKIEFHLELVDNSEKIKDQVVATYKFIVEYVGTEFNCLISDEEYNLATSIEELQESLVNYYNSLFYDSRVQTFVFKFRDTWNFYDPYLIEFIRRNSLMSYGDKYMYVGHQTYVSPFFGYEYSKSFLYAIESHDLKCFGNLVFATADLITDANSLFVNRLQDYYQIKYNDKDTLKTRFTVLDEEVIQHILDNELFDDNSSKKIYNVLISYMNDDEDYMTQFVADCVHDLDIADEQSAFYLIPIYIFILSSYLKNNVLSTTSENN